MPEARPVVVALGRVLPSGKARRVQISTERFAVLGEPTLQVGDPVILSEMPGDETRPQPTIWAEKAE